MAFLFAGLIALGTIAVIVLVLGADMMSDNPSAYTSPVPVAVIGFGISALVAASHWMPHLSW